ncbi:rhomboid protease PCP1 KNAG_0B01030 [Huiozyma naganishii CBS 8797]|uniref:Peptidase S54 rhomboid domain-containing protein n=1 Tax=Huiozyma naganishii (strain ATCC MYA-139 / BCRC 22969 / CBS 8797 / KCTC 17520 / NBRC 10181 / NCYC 3082 / Yp74L-3) TaxID=1071383 RepID=J7R180_HUIN7|nr:hypothetical protein KNAG_0B01030 [Kazachstania naganishii CBS 8797]CCK68550.1 hypothetical protein KNAG_0B01030 [Kazachstania naganishii CBS 8797]
MVERRRSMKYSAGISTVYISRDPYQASMFGITTTKNGLRQCSCYSGLMGPSVLFRKPFLAGGIGKIPLIRTIATGTILKLNFPPKAIDNKLTFKRQFSSTNHINLNWNDDPLGRYNRLNRFQQYQRQGSRQGSNLRQMTLIGIASMVALFFGSSYLFTYVPPFTYYKRKPKEFVYTLLGINIAIFGLWQLPRCWNFLQRYMLLQKGHSSSSWSIIGSAFSHQEFWHLGMNMLALWSFGTSLATMLGTSNFFSLYMNSAIGGSLFSLWYPKIARLAMLGPSLGASGALFGVFGCFAYLIPHAKILLFVFPIPGGAWVAFLASVAWNAAGSALRWGSFDYAAHLGGSAIGVFYGWLISKTIQEKKNRRLERASRWI